MHKYTFFINSTVILFVSPYLPKYLNKGGLTQIKKVKYTKAIKKTYYGNLNHIHKVTLLFTLSSDPYLFMVYVTVR